MRPAWCRIFVSPDLADVALSRYGADVLFDASGQLIRNPIRPREVVVDHSLQPNTWRLGNRFGTAHEAWSERERRAS